MATVMKLNWPGIGPEEYDQARREVNWEGNAPEGAKYHVAWFDNNGCHVLDVWNSQEEFQRFASERLMPGIQKLGIEGTPTIEFSDAHATFAPNP